MRPSMSLLGTGALLFGLSAGGLALAQPALAQTVTLDVLYAFPGFARFHEPLAQQFMKQNPDIRIQFRAPAPSYDEGHQTMIRQSMTSQLPDLYYAGFHLLPELATALARRKQIVDLGPLLAQEDAGWRKANYAEKILALGRVDGKQYGMPFNASMPIVYYNEELVRRAGGDPDRFPDRWDGVLDLARRIHAAQPDAAGISYDVHGWPDDWLWRAMILQAGGKMLNDAGTETAFGGKVGLDALRTFRRFVTEGAMPLIDWDQSRQQFAAGKTGIYIASPANLKQVTDLNGGKFKLRTAVFPIDDKQAGGAPTGGNAVLITSADPARQKAAWAFVKFVTGPEAQKMVVEMSGYLPTNQQAVGPEFLGPFYDANPNFRTVVAQMDRSLPWQGYPGSNSVRIWRTQRDIITAVMRGDESPEAGLDKLVKETNALMR